MGFSEELRLLLWLCLCDAYRLSRLRLAARHRCCCPWWSSQGTGISQMLGLPLQLGYIISDSLSCALFRNINSTTHCQASAAPHDPFNAFKTSATCFHLYCQGQLHEAQTWPGLEQSSCVLILRKTLSRRVHLNDTAFCSIPVGFSVLASREYPSNAKVSQHWFWPLVITADSSAPANQNHGI